MLIANLPAHLAGHVAVALRRHRQWAAQQSVRVPPGFAELEAALTSRATEGQSGTPLADLWEFSQAHVVSPQLLTYESAAAVLSVSVRQIKRLVADCSLPAVSVGRGAVRIRVRDLEEFVRDLTTTKETAA